LLPLRFRDWLARIDASLPSALDRFGAGFGESKIAKYQGA